MEVTVIYPHQLFTNHPALEEGRPIYLIEEPLILTHNPIHTQKLMFHKLTMDAYERELTDNGYQVTRLSIGDYKTTADTFKTLKKAGVTQMHICDTIDDYLEQAIEQSEIERIWHETPLFILEKQDAMERFTKSNRFMASFYKELRKDKQILVDKDNKPVGGAWSFDEDNRERIPKDATLPEDIQFFGNQDTKAAEAWVKSVDAEQYGEAGCWLPYTHDGAEKFLAEFFRARFHNFGPYEDAITTDGIRLWHSAISPLMNVGLLTPQQVLDEALTYAREHAVPLNSLEGFVRQILGWREFMRASYEVDGRKMRSKNFWKHERALPQSFWDGTTGVDPVDHTIKTALAYGYTHHIERLMVMGNFMLLSQMHPDAVYRWFMGLYLDAYDWVMVPNVYGMSQFADGGSFATKPYISGANYIKKMSDHESGDWEKTWTALYWHFIGTHRTFFESNHRLSMMPKTLDRMKDETKAMHKENAEAYLQNQKS